MLRVKPGGFWDKFLAGLSNQKTVQQRLAENELQAALMALYDFVWNQMGTVDISDRVPGYNGISYEDDLKIEELCLSIEQILHPAPLI